MTSSSTVGEGETEGHANGAAEPPSTPEAVSLSEEDRATLNRELEACQDRIVRVLVPTIISFGITSIGQVGGGLGGVLGYTTLFGALFAVLFSSSLYIASMSYKIFERAAFLRVLGGEGADWEQMVHTYRDQYKPRVIGSETTAIGWIYMTLSVMYAGLFLGQIWWPFVVGASVTLFSIGFVVWALPQRFVERRMTRQVEEVVDSLTD